MSVTHIIGGGMTGLAAGYASGLPVLESATTPGGICASLYARPGAPVTNHPHDDDQAYRFEVGGGHWIFGGDPEVLRFMEHLTPMVRYSRRAAVYFATEQGQVPYPLQNNLAALAEAGFVKEAHRALEEIMTGPLVPNSARTMAEWLETAFGPTLNELFFRPFNNRYTAGWLTSVAPQDAYKSPVDRAQVLRGALGLADPVGYNTTFLYPRAGLDALARGLAEHADVRYASHVIEITRQGITLADGRLMPRGDVISTLPLDVALEVCGLDVDGEPDPHTGVLVLNIGGKKGVACPDEHWLYVPDADAPFHRVGFYSNVDEHFLPARHRGKNSHTSLYVERAVHSDTARRINVEEYTRAVVEELNAWCWLDGEPDVVDATWIDHAYTWSRPHSRWRQRALAALAAHGVHQVGRYATWRFFGIAESIRDGLVAGAAARAFA